MKERITFASVIRRRLPPWIERQPHPTYRGGVGGRSGYLDGEGAVKASGLPCRRGRRETGQFEGTGSQERRRRLHELLLPGQSAQSPAGASPPPRVEPRATGRRPVWKF